MAIVAATSFERSVLIGHQQPLAPRRVRIVAGSAIGLAQIVTLMHRLERLILLMAAETKCRHVIDEKFGIASAVRIVALQALLCGERLMQSGAIHPVIHHRMATCAQLAGCLFEMTGKIGSMSIMTT